MTTFTETQQNPYRWYLAAFAGVLPIILLWQRSLSKFHELWMDVAMLAVYSLVAALVFITIFRKIIYRFDQNGIHYCIKPFGRWQIIHWTDIERAYVREYALYGEYPKGFSGTRQGPNGWAYVMDGTYGLQINKKSGGKILLGTQRPDELQAFLAANSTLTTT